MDWLRARLVLLVTFLCLNTLLVYRLWNRDFQSTGVFTLGTQEHLNVVLSRLNAVGISVSGTIPTKVPSLSLLRVERTTPAFGGDLFAQFGADALPFPPPMAQEFKTTAGTLRLAPSGLSLFTNPVQPAGSRAAPSSRVSRRLVDDFFKRHGGLPPDAEYVGLAQTDEERVRVDYVQMWKGVPLLPTGLSATVTSGGVEQVQWLWLKPQGDRGDPKAVLPASEALLRLAGHLGDRQRQSPLVFTRVDLGYYAMPPGGAQVWDTAPVWRITVEDGEIFYINAFTGELEQS